ncbi:PepSY domain-containing protein [Paenibacillus sp. FSL K6-1217]|uniref:PepSY domain-containing protein n=1 Tax=Paenibacillus sp. FSL K6-1217 TaxID=2921466 RepID=UPI003250F206
MNRNQVNKRMIFNVVMGIAALLLLALAAFWMFGKDSEPLLSQDQAEQAVLSEYAGKVDSLKLQAGAYVAELQTEQGRYELKLDGVTGEILSIVLLKHADEPAVQPTSAASPAPSGGAAPTRSPAPTPAAQSLVSEEEAVRLALLEVPGELDDVDTGIDAAGAFYLVEIHTSDGREAVVQVNAISGKIMSVTWEEPDGEDS